jgi:hypothetical protein
MIVFKIRMVDPGLEIQYWDDLGNLYAEVPSGTPTTDAPTQAEAMQLLREYRNARLLESDYTQLDDAPLTPAQKEAYREYRQAWRDYPASVNVETWQGPAYPTKPVL